MLHQLLTYTFLFFLSSCAFFTAMKEQVSLTKEDKVVLEEFYHKGKIKRETFICKDKSNQDEAYCGYYQTIRNFCHDKKISQSSCESHSLGKLLCMSLDAKTGFCGDVSVPQALCMLSGKSRLICEGVDFKKALCIYEGGSLTYCDSLMKRAQFEDEVLKEMKDKRIKRENEKSKNNNSFPSF